jgi:hypothetical protein
MVSVLLTLHNPEHFINPYVICNTGHGILFFCHVRSKWAPFSYTKLSVYVNLLVYIYILLYSDGDGGRHHVSYNCFDSF